jgi:hypothetical protein
MFRGCGGHVSLRIVMADRVIRERNVDRRGHGGELVDDGRGPTHILNAGQRHWHWLGCLKSTYSSE